MPVGRPPRGNSYIIPDFSVTSGTILANRKLPFRTLLAAVVLSVQSVKGKAALQLSRELSVQYKTAWVLSHKLRKAVRHSGPP